MNEDSEELRIYIKMAKTRISSLYHDTAGACYLSFSGGKDSTVVLALIKECIEDGLIYSEIPAVYANTGIELQATNDFVNWVKDNYYSNVDIVEPEKSFAQIIKEHGKPFRSKLKSEAIDCYQSGSTGKRVEDLIYSGKERRLYKLSNKDFHVLHEEFEIKISNDCCKYMKKIPFKKYASDNGCLGYLQGLRACEGGARLFNYQRDIESGKSPCTKISGDFIIKSPIIDWDDNILNEFIENHKVPLSRAYTEYGRKRTGCFLCPFNLEIEQDLTNLHKYEPNQYKAAMAWLKDIYIAQNVVLKFDTEYERERESTWRDKYSKMRYEMLKKYRPDCKLVKDYEAPKQLSFFEFEGE